MIRAWIGISLLAGSWMFGLGYFYPANNWIWLGLIAAGTMLLGGNLFRLPAGRESAIALVLLLPALFFVPWPLKIMPLLIILGLVLHLLPFPHPNPLPTAGAVPGEGTISSSPHPNPLRAPTEGWSGEGTIERLANGAVCAGVVLAVQALVLVFYTAETAHSHELPWPLPDLLAGIANLLSIDAAADGAKIVMHSMRQVHRLGATWELLLDPVTMCFYFGGLVLLGLTAWSQLPEGQRWAAWIRALRILTLIIVLWLPVRAGLLIAVYMYRVLRAEPDRALFVMNHFFSPWVLLCLLAVPLLLIWRFLRIKSAEPITEHLHPAPLPKGERTVSSSPHPNPLPKGEGKASVDLFPKGERNSGAMPVILVALAAALVTAGVLWNPVGKHLGGRVKVVERHSTWEPTTKPYDTTWYGEPSGYNYAAIYDYLAQYYEMSRLLETDKIDDQTLSQCDVLVIKTPTARYSRDEVAAVLRFVDKGGGVLFIGDHTNIYRMGTIMNDITRPMGFVFRDDILFSNEASAYDQHFDLPWAAHPSLQYMTPMDFAGSCSIDPGFNHGRAVITSTGLWSMGPEYHHENYFPIAQYCPEMQYGAFIQAWAAWYGQGRAMAFTDSTIFSNFATFQPGKAELMLGMIQWLNHANPTLDPRPWLFLLGAVSLGAGIILVRRRPVAWLVLMAAAMCAWALTSEGVPVMHRRSMPWPKIQKPLTRVVIDRTTSDAPLSKGAYTQGDGSGYGLLEQLISRLGYYTIRQEGEAAFSGDVLVAICPDRPVDASFREHLKRYVAEGGKLLVFDTPENVNSTANSLLWPFGLSVQHQQAWKGTLTLVDNWPAIEVPLGYEVTGGKAVAWFGQRPVAAIARHGKGTVMAVGFSSLLNDKMMGDEAQWMVVPDAAMRQRYEVLYGLVRLLVENKPVKAIASIGEMPPADALTPSEGGKDKVPLQLPELPMKELGPQ